MDFCADFSEHFVIHGRDSNEHARHYLGGLLGTQRRKNMERIGEDLEASNYQGVRQFVSDSPWDVALRSSRLARLASSHGAVLPGATLQRKRAHRLRVEYPLLSVCDIVELLAFYLPRKTRNEKDVLESLRERHRLRQKDIDRRRKIAAILTK